MSNTIREELYHPLPQPDEISSREKEDAMGSYLMMFASMAVGLPLPVMNIIAAVIYYYVNRSKGRFVRFHTLQSLYSQIPVTILNIIMVVLFVHTLVNELEFTNVILGYFAMAGIANLIYFAFSIVGAVKSHRGHFYYFWLFGAWAYEQVYSIKNNPEEEYINKPPL